MGDPSVRRVLIVGAGTMGRGIAALCASRGFDVALHDPVPAALDAAPGAIAALLEKARARGKMTEEEARTAARCVRTVRDL
ncbi:MAG TPA: 3-hydroxyacyl-CoA dehydrogenase NAD-binding domain-containing protein, partial [Thermoanaerobaculia bacterium]|nr:3-hydroxyacyl-CoA dehydrogenase NAD-binding domain-containing protein [Thermoanaerobaculia bacterium]